MVEANADATRENLSVRLELNDNATLSTATATVTDGRNSVDLPGVPGPQLIDQTFSVAIAGGSVPVASLSVSAVSWKFDGQITVTPKE
jgi:hypothetical protein